MRRCDSIGAPPVNRGDCRALVVIHNLTLILEGTPMVETTKVKGPASYFPSIEKTYGKPIA
jgi:hypothetical protein